ncbi:MAG TPA: PPOX class F420-dependent oxidoreductase [Solirubrobacteraceae bacterium]|jgi:PPOX class probable F420-dependent enzyme|nr:PPOX class F420-dependent oxidoreductase [Solirubrobacteraceae bacterium]
MARDMSPAERREFMTQGTRTAKVATAMADGHPHVMPVWFILDGDDVVFTTGRDSVKGCNLRRDPRIALVVDEDLSPYAFVHVRGQATWSEDLAQLERYAIQIGGRYMGSERAREFGRRNAVPGELLVRVTPERVIAKAEVAA